MKNTSMKNAITRCRTTKRSGLLFEPCHAKVLFSARITAIHIPPPTNTITETPVFFCNVRTRASEKNEKKEKRSLTKVESTEFPEVVWIIVALHDPTPQTGRSYLACCKRHSRKNGRYSPHAKMVEELVRASTTKSNDKEHMNNDCKPPIDKRIREKLYADSLHHAQARIVDVGRLSEIVCVNERCDQLEHREPQRRERESKRHAMRKLPFEESVSEHHQCSKCNRNAVQYTQCWKVRIAPHAHLLM